jgi:hypothetical protein
MAKRFTETEIWEEDWYLAMPKDYKLFWFYMLSMCDHAGFYKVNLRSFCALNEVKVSSATALEYFNSGKDRLRILNENFWFIEDFIVFQYGTTFNINNPLHRGIKKLLDKNEIPLETVRGIKEIIMTPKRPQNEDSLGLKDKDKDKEIYKDDSKIEGKSKGDKGGSGEQEEKGTEERKEEETPKKPKQPKTHTTSTSLSPIAVVSISSERDISVNPLNRLSMPFGDSFANLWLEWRRYRWEQHQFKYKNDGSEQAALHDLVTTARGREEAAIAIIKQSMARGWKGFFDIKNNSNGTKQPTGKDVQFSDLYAAIGNMPD